MSSLIVAHDLHLMMLEVSLDKVHVPRCSSSSSSALEAAVLKQTTVMFRLLDEEWTSIMPQRADHRAYRGSNRENETFEGGRSLVFSVPEGTLGRPMEGPLHLQVHVRKQLSRYFELEPCQSVGFVLLRVEHLFNGIIGELLAEVGEDSRQEPKERNQEPISRSLKGRFKILDENLRDNGAFLDLYARLSYFGKSIVTEIESADTRDELFYLGRGVSPSYLYWVRETILEELQSGCCTIRSTFFPSKRTGLSLSCACYANDADRQGRTVIRAELNEHQPMGYDEQLMTASEEIIIDETAEARDIEKGKSEQRKEEARPESTKKRKSPLTSESAGNPKGENLSTSDGEILQHENFSKRSVKDNLLKNLKNQNEQTAHKKTGKAAPEVESKMDDRKKEDPKSIAKILESASSRLFMKSTENKIDTQYTKRNNVNPPNGNRTMETIRKKVAGHSRVRDGSLNRRLGAGPAGPAVNGAILQKGGESTCRDATYSECRRRSFDGRRQPVPSLCHLYESYCTYYPACWPRCVLEPATASSCVMPDCIPAKNCQYS